jgi:hypothetical protein
MMAKAVPQWEMKHSGARKGDRQGRGTFYFLGARKGDILLSWARKGDILLSWRFKATGNRICFQGLEAPGNACAPYGRNLPRRNKLP